jgi:AraC-like DNA-binding protein
VRKLRLARCAADLRSAASDGTGITDIAFRWGFNDSAHFSKAFRAEFGQSPRDYRARHRGSTVTLNARTPAPRSAAAHPQRFATALRGPQGTF